MFDLMQDVGLITIALSEEKDVVTALQSIHSCLSIVYLAIFVQ